MASEWAAERRAGKSAKRPVRVLKYLSQVQHACCLSVWAEIYMLLVGMSSVSSTARPNGGTAKAIVYCGFSCGNGPGGNNPHANHMPTRPLSSSGRNSSNPLAGE